jgi:hypothetical protein
MGWRRSKAGLGHALIGGHARCLKAEDETAGRIAAENASLRASADSKRFPEDPLVVGKLEQDIARDAEPVSLAAAGL